MSALNRAATTLMGSEISAPIPCHAALYGSSRTLRRANRLARGQCLPERISCDEPVSHDFHKRRIGIGCVLKRALACISNCRI
jgi:hypothetical protein